MKLVLFGPTGMIGSCIFTEALSRGHMLTAVTRDPSRLAQVREGVHTARVCKRIGQTELEP